MISLPLFRSKPLKKRIQIWKPSCKRAEMRLKKLSKNPQMKIREGHRSSSFRKANKHPVNYNSSLEQRFYFRLLLLKSFSLYFWTKIRRRHLGKMLYNKVEPLWRNCEVIFCTHLSLNNRTVPLVTNINIYLLSDCVHYLASNKARVVFLEIITIFRTESKRVIFH